MNYFQNCTSLDQAKQIYKNLVFELHPDISGYESTADFQELQNQFEKFKPASEKFKGEFNAWNATEYARIIDQLLSIPEIGISVCGSWIWLYGNTKPYKEQIKKIDCGESMRRGWSPTKMQWYFSPIGYRKKSSKTMDFEEIKSKYGEQKVTRIQKTALT